MKDDKELKAFCAYIENSVADKESNEYRGEWAYKFLMDRLYECEKLALTSNSFINVICEEPS